MGAESTGTTTLAMGLAERLSVPWVPEYLRQYAEDRATEAGSIWDVIWTPADLDRVADGQDRLEAEVLTAWNAGVERARAGPAPLLICDTDTLAVALWARRYLGAPAPHLLRRAAANPPALYVLTDIGGVAFFQDGLRDGEHIRPDMHAWFRATLAGQPVPWIKVTGDPATRLRQALAAIDQLAGDPRATPTRARRSGPPRT